ncbi:GTP cyclohydrolase I FolE [Phosphitispora fastidiosa]|uniref:GTP cyclohydrolase I FolE n=1 Tax=Phosphitispora fastidiosa TaxID=2837202 RepID=UPI001E3D2E8F|nr:GTP cyclohydrolase I FolE [Phosphitispora fastidiosa]MBU7005367.1 GTP cyclohydrolase I [Phosphitispora fastidiosa]
MFDKEKIETAVRMILEAIGEDPEREGLVATPSRVARMYEEIFCGMYEDPRKHLQVMFTEDHEEMVLIKDIPFYSMCEHHLLPFFGQAHVAYIPRKGKITGLSKLARTVETIAKRPQLQERLTCTIADMIMESLNALGVLVVVEAEHMCMTMRGVKKPGSMTLTSAVRGLFKSSQATRAEAFSLIRKH